MQQKTASSRTITTPAVMQTVVMSTGIAYTRAVDGELVVSPVDAELVVSLEGELDDPSDPEVDTLVAEFSVVDEVKRRTPLLVQSPESHATRAIRRIGAGLISEPSESERTRPRGGFLSGLLRTFGRR